MSTLTYNSKESTPNSKIYVRLHFRDAYYRNTVVEGLIFSGFEMFISFLAVERNILIMVMLARLLRFET